MQSSTQYSYYGSEDLGDVVTDCGFLVHLSGLLSHLSTYALMYGLRTAICGAVLQ